MTHTNYNFKKKSTPPFSLLPHPLRQDSLSSLQTKHSCLAPHIPIGDLNLSSQPTGASTGEMERSNWYRKQKWNSILFSLCRTRKGSTLFVRLRKPSPTKWSNSRCLPASATAPDVRVFPTVALRLPLMSAGKLLHLHNEARSPNTKSQPLQ